MLQIRVRRVVVGPSSGIATVGEEIREAVDLRDARVWVDDLRERREAVEARADTFPGMISIELMINLWWS